MMKYLKIVSGLLIMLFTFQQTSAQLASEKPVASLYAAAAKQKPEVAEKHPENVRAAGPHRLPSAAALPAQAIASKKKGHQALPVQAPFTTPADRLPGNSRESVQEISSRKMDVRRALRQSRSHPLMHRND